MILGDPRQADSWHARRRRLWDEWTERRPDNVFVRRQRGMELTEAGRHFVHHAQAVLAHVGLLEASMNNAGKETRPANQIGILDTA